MMMRISEAGTPMTSARIDSIQVLRAIAALAVVIFHSHYAVDIFGKDAAYEIPFLAKWGYLGVDLFFAISGFIIAHITIGRNFSLKEFAVRRFFRIYPIYAFFCLISFYLFLTKNWRFGPHDFTLENLALSIAIAPIDGSPAYGVGWSLEHEIIFYATAALCLSFGNLKLLCSVIFGVAAVGFAKDLAVARGVIEPFWDYHLLSPLNIFFLTGMLLRLFLSKIKTLGWAAPAMLSVVTCAISISLMKNANVELRMIGRYLVLAAAIAAMIIAFLNFKIDNPSRLDLVIYKFFTEIGNASYSLYLVHWIVLKAVGLRYFVEMFGVQPWAAELWRYSWILACVIISLLMYRFIEKPIIRFGEHVLQRSKKVTEVTAPAG
ncbi:acyltransferase [Pseudomonas stutzeri]|uniref:acyltransferase family protein n=1 Tax=Stutzerimonas stutzeri TaxID=316 RepID=UPI002109F6B8|nr:acyltransferase [Stutzerimonas stutzeri]MCQ4308888.1 acyltransferase [Stutzerimonas stutzeri]